MSGANQTEAPCSLYFGDVMHARLKPVGHRFSYRVMSLLIDLDRLDEAGRQSRLFGVNRAALYSFHEADHGERDGSSLRAYAQVRASEHRIGTNGYSIETIMATWMGWRAALRACSPLL